MNWRVLISVVNLLAIVIAFVILYEFPQYSDDAFYILISWMVVGFVLLYSLRPRGPPVPGGAPPGASPFPSTAAAAETPLPSSEPSGGIGFCIYCATPIAPGTRACPACGHALPRW